MSIQISPASIVHLNRGKKRKLNLDTWKQIRRKQSRDAGKEYISSRNVIIAAIPSPNNVERPCQCRRGCDSQDLIGKHMQLFRMFRGLNYNEQKPVPARRKVAEAISRRQCTVKYYVENVKVCQKTICNIFGVTSRRIQYLNNKIKEGRDLIDYRGKHVNCPNKMTETDIEKICQHIRPFPLQENHYSRNESSRQCLSPDLDLKKRHRLFVEKYPDSNISERTYTDIFKSKFNLRFGIPRSDTYGYCDKLYIKLCATDDEGERQAIMRESKLHHMRAHAGYKTLKLILKWQSITRTLVLFADLEQRQLATHNYAIHDAAEGNATMMLWHEGMAHRGSTEIASTLLFYIWQRFDPLHLVRSAIVSSHATETLLKSKDKKEYLWFMNHSNGLMSLLKPKLKSLPKLYGCTSSFLRILQHWKKLYKEMQEFTEEDVKKLMSSILVTRHLSFSRYSVPSVVARFV
nr:unnamed protein product [Callosobruchus chinensis]